MNLHPNKLTSAFLKHTYIFETNGHIYLDYIHNLIKSM